MRGSGRRAQVRPKKATKTGDLTTNDKMLLYPENEKERPPPPPPPRHVSGYEIKNPTMISRVL